MPRFGMVIDTRKCVGCMDCVVACKTENDVPDGFCRDWISQRLEGTMPDLRLTITSERCNHCDRPPCVSCCPTGASHVHEFGKVVLVDHEKCIGCKACLASCPYGARFIHPAHGYLADVVDGPDGDDWTWRPNQIFAVALYRFGTEQTVVGP